MSIVFPVRASRFCRRPWGGSLIAFALTAAACSSSTPAPTPITPATFVMTWPGVTFPTTGVGATSSTPIVVTLWNNGASAVPVASVTDSNTDEFPFTTTCQVGGALAPASTCSVTTRFKPSAVGTRNATLTINANGTAQDLALTGTGASINPQLTIAPAGAVAPGVFTLSLTGATPSATVELHTIYTPAPGNPPATVATTTWATDASGSVTASVTTTAPGTYEHWMLDVTSGTSTNHVIHTVP